MEIQLLNDLKKTWDNIFKLQQATEYNTRSINDIYPDTVVVLFFNSTADDTNNPATFIPSTYDAYWDELQLLGQAGLAPGTSANNNPLNNPYSIVQRPITNFDYVLNAQNVFLEKLEYFAYDTTVAGGLGQDPAVIAEIYSSRTTDEIYGQSYFRNAMLPINWQPNFFRPSFVVNNEEMIKGQFESFYGEKNNIGDLSIGMPLPACFTINKALGKIDNGVLSLAQVAQIIDVGGTKYFQRYPVLTVATFKLGSRKNSW
jgi:hypothetical protein